MSHRRNTHRRQPSKTSAAALSATSQSPTQAQNARVDFGRSSVGPGSIAQQEYAERQRHENARVDFRRPSVGPGFISQQEYAEQQRQQRRTNGTNTKRMPAAHVAQHLRNRHQFEPGLGITIEQREDQKNLRDYWEQEGRRMDAGRKTKNNAAAQYSYGVQKSPVYVKRAPDLRLGEDGDRQKGCCTIM